MHLDPHGEDEEGKEGYIEEQRVVHTHHPSTDSLEDVPGNRAEFRGQGGGKNLRRRGVKGPIGKKSAGIFYLTPIIWLPLL